MNTKEIKEDYYEKWQENYYNNRYIDIMKYLSKKDIALIGKLGIIVEEKIYTDHELEIIYLAMLEYYKNDDMDKEDLALSKSLTGSGLSRKIYNELLNKVYKINHCGNVC